MPVPGKVAARLRVPAGSQVVCRSEDRLIDGIPWSRQSSYYPMKFATEDPNHRLLVAENIEEGVVRYLDQKMDVRQTSYRDWITARAPDGDEQQFFGISHDSMVFDIFRSAFDQHGNAMRVTVTVFPADRNQFIVNVGNPPDAQYESG